MISEYRLDPPDDPQGFTGTTEHQVERDGEWLTIEVLWCDGEIDDVTPLVVGDYAGDVVLTDEEREAIMREGETRVAEGDYDDRADEAYDQARDAEFDR